jgi:hypothetical protein
VRGLQFAVPGAAIGVTLSIGVSILRVAFADVDAWVPLVLVPTIVAFGIGYLAPGPLSRSIRDVKAEEALQAAAEQAVARATGAHEPATSGGFLPRRRPGKAASRATSAERVPAEVAAPADEARVAAGSGAEPDAP